MSSSSPNRGRYTAPPVARHGQLRAGNPAVLVLKFIAAALAVVLVSALGVTGFAVYSITSAIRPGVALPGETKVNAPQIGAIDGAVNLLLVGSDSGQGNPAYGRRGEVLNDVTLLLHISKDHKRATVVSIPRDMFVDIPACPNPGGTPFAPERSQKINTTLSRGGLACPVLTVEQLTGIDIPYAAKIEFDGVIAMSNAVGGVPVCVATPINDRQISFKLSAGSHKLQGEDALQFLRSRYGVGDGSDLTRISNQQQFLSSLVRTLKSSETLSNPVKLYGIAKAATQNLEFSNSLKNVDTMVSIASALKDIPLADVVFVKYPGTIGMSGSQSGVLPLTSAATELFAAIAADQPIALTGTTGGGTVADPTAPVPGVTPSSSAAPGPSPSVPVAPSQGASPPPSASPTPTPIPLPTVIEGQNASQQTCTAGQTAGG